MGAAELHVKLGISNGVAQLITGPASCKNAKRRSKRNKALQCQPRRDREHILLLHTTVEETIRKNLFEIASLTGFGHVRVKHDEIGEFMGELDEGLHVALASLFEWHAHEANSFIARSNSCWSGGVPCQRLSPSIKGTPLPL